jgi:hypothetical protein
MKWKKLGQIFKFNQTPFKERFVSHAQSPQAIVFDDFIRIYFTTRQKDSRNTFISIPQYVDFSKDFSEIIDYSRDSIISHGNLGCFDEHGIFPFSPIRINDKIYAYTTGWTRRVSVDVETGIGLAIGDSDGKWFERLGKGPVLSASLHEPFLVCDGFVRFFNGVFHMWYIYGTSWKVYEEGRPPDRTYIIGHATSENGIDWIKDAIPVIRQKYDTECQALPTVIKVKNKYYMCFCCRNSFDFRNNPQKTYDLYFAYSDDLIHWERFDTEIGLKKSNIGGDWDCNMTCYPNLFEMDGKIYLLYNGNGFGKDGFGIAILENEIV